MENNVPKESKIKNLLSHAGRALVLLVLIFLVVYFVMVAVSSSAFYTESAIKNSLIDFATDVDLTNGLVNQHYDNLYELAEKLKGAKNADEVIELIKPYTDVDNPTLSDKFGSLRYYVGAESYDATGALVEIEHSANEQIEDLVESGKAGSTGVYFNTHDYCDCIAFFTPVRGEYVNGVLSIVPAINIVKLDSVIEADGKALATAIIDKKGRVFSSKTSADFDKPIGADYFEFIEKITGDHADVITVSALINAGLTDSGKISSFGTDYVVAATPIELLGGEIYLLTLYESSSLVSEEYVYIRHIGFALVLAVLALAIGLIYSILYHKKAKAAIHTAALTDARLECANAEQFRIDAVQYVYSGRRKHAVVAFAIRKFHQISDRLGPDNSTAVLKYIAKVIESFVEDGETFGYDGDGRFLILEIYKSERSFKDKIRLLQTVINQNEILAQNSVKLKFDIGVYLTNEGRRRSVVEMIECANSSCEHAAANPKQPYVVFTEQMRAELARDEQIESEMEKALAEREFRLFLQPKYNVKADRIDSAEALVRWFDPRRGDYMFPAQFISLFESNGFITKLDHFIYIEVLEYLSRAAERGEKIVPISVNVSRVTAVADDFINFYVGNKKKYRIGDGFITIEFTESFAMEDYDKLYEMVNGLHNNGIRCSIDDFGSGYSSFSILKQIPVDELKLDRVFMQKGASEERDNKLLSTVIDLAKSMDMTVVQEGVETKEMFERVCAMGCDVIQGYYYAKALPLEEYRLFINSNTSIKYKSLVK